MKHIVSFSGGMGSFAEAKACVDKFGKKNVLLLFADTMMEDEDLYRFKNECIAFLGCELVTLSDGRTPFEIFKDVKFMGNSMVDPCVKRWQDFTGQKATLESTGEYFGVINDTTT